MGVGDDVLGGTSVDALAQLLGTVVLIQKVVRDLLEVGQMAVQQGAADGQEVRVARVVDLDDAPRVLSGSHAPAADLDHVVRADDGEWHQAAQLRVLLHRVLVVLLGVVREVVDRDPVVLDIFHHQLLGLGQFGRRQRVGLANDRDHIHARRQTLHELDVEFAQTESHVSSLDPGVSGWKDLPVARRRDEVQ